MEQQTTLVNLKRFKPLTDGQRKVLFLLNQGLTQTYIAPRLHISRPRVNQIVKKLECELGLIHRVQNNKQRDGVRNYSYFYTLTDRAKQILKGDLDLEELTPWRVHNHRMRFDIIHKTGEPCTDKRCGFEKSWKMRGWTAYEFWWHTDINLPSCSMIINPKNIVFFTPKGTKINARTKEEAMELGWIAIRKSMEWFVSKQAEFGVYFSLEPVGKQIGKLHLGLEANENGPLKDAYKAQKLVPDERVFGVKHPRYADASNKKELGQGKFECEVYEDDPILTPIENVFDMAVKLPDALQKFNEALGPVSANVEKVYGILQGGLDMNRQSEMMLSFMTKVLSEMQAIREENRQLKERLGI